MKWEGNEAKGPSIEYAVGPGERFAKDADGRKIDAVMTAQGGKVGKTEPCVVLRRRVQQITSIGPMWGNWGVVGNFNTADEAKAYAENI